MRIVLDASVLGDLLNPTSTSPQVVTVREWGLEMLGRGEEFVLPGVADHEVRRKLLHLGKAKSIRRLDDARRDWSFLPVTQGDVDLASELWADARRRGRPAAPDAALDGDMLLCAQTRRLSERVGGDVVVATTNVKHLEDFVDARLPSSIP